MSLPIGADMRVLSPVWRGPLKSSEDMVAVEGDDGIEELVGIGERLGVGVDREDGVLQTGLTDALPVVGRRDPEIGGPHLDPELLGEEDRSQRFGSLVPKLPLSILPCQSARLKRATM